MNRIAKAFGLPAVLAAMMTLGACAHKQVAKSTPPPPPPPPAAPTIALTASPDTVTQGQSTQLQWQAQNATEVTLQGIGAVDASGSRTVTPTESTTYVAVAKGPGGTQEASARITVNPPVSNAEPTPSDEDLFARNVKDLYFDYDKYQIRQTDEPNANSDAQFFVAHPNIGVLIEGHCDDRGSEEYNLALGDSRANSMKQALLSAGVNADRIKTISYGKERPFCTSDDEQCWQQNRRAHLVFQK